MKRLGKLVAIACGLMACLSLNSFSAPTEGDPNRIQGWVLVYEHDAEGTPVAGNILELADAARSGADVKVGYPSNPDPYGNIFQNFFNCDWVYAANDGDFVTCVNTSPISVRARKLPQNSVNISRFFYAIILYKWFFSISCRSLND